MQNANGKCLFANRRFGTCSFPALACVAALVFLAISAPGCKQSSGTVSIRGRVSRHTEPLKAGMLTFFPAAGRPGTAAICGGDYEIELMPGEYTVVVSIAPELPPGYKEGDPPPPPPKVVLPDEYTTRAKSTLKATVKAGQDQPIDFDLK
jgi:hypothetical protein